MSTLYILVGLPFSGKSTLLKTVSEYTNIIPISFDELWKELEQDSIEKEKLSFEYVSKIVDEKVTQLLKDEYSVMYDSLNDTLDQRERLCNIAESSNASSQIIYLDTPLEVVKMRRENNTKNMERHQVEDENFEKAINKFIVPTEEENPMIFRYDENIVDWVKEKLSEYIK